MATRARMLSVLETPPRVSKIASRNPTSKKRKQRKPAVPPIEQRKPAAPPTEQRKPDALARSMGERASTAKSRASEDGSFPIVGIGASAGGLEALEQFLRPLPDKSGMAFVVVQHLDPTHKGMMAELLQRATPMKVSQVKDRQKVEPNRVYVIPPNKDLSILHGVLHLLAPAAPRGLRLPIDFFFRSLADDQKERSIGVILSGMGSDGTLGREGHQGAGGRGLRAGARLGQVRRHAPQRHRRRARRRRGARRGAGREVARLSRARAARRGPTMRWRQDPERHREGLRSSCATRPATTSRSTRGAPCTAASSGAWRCTSSTASPATSDTCRRARRRRSSSSRSCSSA